jgi:hypothetical protein
MEPMTVLTNRGRAGNMETVLMAGVAEEGEVGAAVPPVVEQIWEELSTADFPPGMTVTTLDEEDLAAKGSF